MLVTRQPVLRRFWYAVMPMARLDTGPQPFTLLGEAIVAPKEIMKYFGTGLYTAKECDFAYNATHMALQWDAVATGDTKVMLAAQHEIMQKPFGEWMKQQLREFFNLPLNGE